MAKLSVEYLLDAGDDSLSSLHDDALMHGEWAEL
jgi:hypothetical protein